MKSFLKWGALGVFSMSLMMGVAACSDDDPDYSNVTPPTVASVASTIGGIVSDKSGDVIVGANVTLEGNGTEAKSVKTGNDGVYLFEDVKPGSYTVSVEADGKIGATSAVTVENSNVMQRYVWNISLAADAEEEITVSTTEETSGTINTETLKGNEIAEVGVTAVVPADAVAGVEAGQNVVVSVKPVYSIAEAEQRASRAQAETMLTGTELTCNVEGATLKEPVELRFAVDQTLADGADVRVFKNGQWSAANWRVEGNDIVVEANDFAVYGVFVTINYTLTDAQQPVSFTQSVWDNLYGSQTMTVGSASYSFKVGSEIETTAGNMTTGLLIEKLAQLYSATATTVTRSYPLNVSLPIGTKLEISGSQLVTTATISGLGSTATLKQYGDVSINVQTSNCQHTGGGN